MTPSKPLVKYGIIALTPEVWAALQRSGYAVVPRELSEPMLRAAWVAALGERSAKRAWRTMLEAGEATV